MQTKPQFAGQTTTEPSTTNVRTSACTHKTTSMKTASTLVTTTTLSTTITPTATPSSQEAATSSAAPTEKNEFSTIVIKTANTPETTEPTIDSISTNGTYVAITNTTATQTPTVTTYIKTNDYNGELS